MKKAIISLLSVLAWGMLAPAGIWAQEKVSNNLICRFEAVGMTGKGDYAPFWHTSNRQGIPSVRKDNGYTHIAALGSMLMPSGLDMDYGVDLGLGAGLQSDLFVHQLYVDLDYKWSCP